MGPVSSLLETSAEVESGWAPESGHARQGTCVPPQIPPAKCGRRIARFPSLEGSGAQCPAADVHPWRAGWWWRCW